MNRFLRLLFAAGVCFISASLLTPVVAQDKTKDDGARDKRLGKYKTLNSYFPFSPPKSLKEWKQRRDFVKAQVQVANGLWPMPKKTPLNPVIHGKIERDGYTVEKVFFESYPGFYVTGSLYRPTNIKEGTKVPAVLCPHGHWGNRSDPKTNGRFYKAGDAGSRGVEAQIKSGAEKTREGAMFPLQARCANLAMLGCVVFHYDMVGYGDSTQIHHPLSKQNPRGAFTDPDAALWLQNVMGLQTWNSIRSLDFLETLPEVDRKRIGVTGASGGGSQTFVLCAVDNRPNVAFPAVMVSTAMQGGCICENCTYLRVNTGNIELAGLFAPRPLAMSGANDWTKEIETKGKPQLKQLYKLYGAEDKVDAKAWTEFGHNYNQVAREFMYNWFNKHLKLGHKSPVTEKKFEPVPPKNLSVFDAKHPRPKKAKTAYELRNYMRADAQRQLRQMFPDNAKKLKRFQKITGTALAVMMNEPALPAANDIEVTKLKDDFNKGDLTSTYMYLSRKGAGERVGAALIKGKKFDGTVVVMAFPDGTPHRTGAEDVTSKGAAVLEVYPFGPAKDGPPPVDKRYHGYTWGYNRTILANRVHDILTAVAYARAQDGVKKVHLVGFGKMGPAAALARALCGNAVNRAAVNLDGLRFEEILSMNDENMQPGALKYGGLAALTAVSAPHGLFVHNVQNADPQGYLAAAYNSAGKSDNLRQAAKRLELEEQINWLLR